MMIVRFLMVTTGLLLIGVAVAAVGAMPYWEPMVREEMAARFGAMLQTEASIGGLAIDPQRQAIVLRDVVVRNPPAFEKGDALRCARVLLIIDPQSVFNSPLRISQIIVEEADVVLRWIPGQGSNLGALAAQARTQAEPPLAAGVSAPPQGRSFVVERLDCTGAKVTPQNVVLGALPIALTVAPFTVADLEAHGPVRPAQLTGIFLRSLLKEIVTLKGLLSPAADLLRHEVAATA